MTISIGHTSDIVVFVSLKKDMKLDHAESPLHLFHCLRNQNNCCNCHVMYCSENISLQGNKFW